MAKKERWRLLLPSKKQQAWWMKYLEDLRLKGLI
jgi:hypothetical protein